MAQRRVHMKKIRDILRMYFEAHLSRRQIAKAIYIARRTVSNYIDAIENAGLSYKEISNMSDDTLLEIIKKPNKKDDIRFKDLSNQFDYIAKELKRTGVTLELLWQEYREKYTDGYSYSQFCYHFSNYRQSCKIYMHIEHKAGDKMFADFTGKKMTIYDRITGEEKEVETFVAILPCSRNTFTYATESQKKEDWIKANDEALWYFGGVPKAIVPDCLKSAVTKADYYEPDINPDYADFAEYYNTVILPARPGKWQDKALVENAVKIIYSRVFAPLRNTKFYSLDELNEAIRERLKIHNNMNFQRLKISRLKLFEEIEKPVLNPLPAKRYELKSFCTSLIYFNYHVWLKEDNHYYSVPWRLRDKNKKEYAKIIYTDRTVEIFHNNIRVAFHMRDKKPGGYTTVKEHMAPHHKFYAEWNPERFKNWASKIGEYVKILVAKILDKRKHPEQGYRSCLGVINLSKKYGNQRLNKACKRAIEFRCYSYKTVQVILKKGLENIQEELPFWDTLPPHENIRGIDYYN